MYFLWHHGEMDVFSSCRRQMYEADFLEVLNDLEQNKKDNTSPA